MSKISTYFLMLFHLWLLPIMPATIYAQQADSKNKVRGTEKTIVVSPDVTISLIAEGTGIKVRGWERDEVRVSSAAGREIEFQRQNETKVKNSPTLLQVRVDGFNGDINLDVPRKATVKIDLSVGNVSVEDVAAAQVVARSGGITLRRISRLVEASSIGHILLKDSGGVIRLISVSGTIEASNVRTINQSDGIRINSVSGDVLLERVTHNRIETTTVTGNILFLGPPAKETICTFDTTQGDITVNLTADVSFQVSVILGENGKFTNEFPLKTVENNNSKGSQRVNGNYGTGGPKFNLASFSGQIHLRLKE
jgi:DUF4097 and DUF4098 domain-containing protein YvlB